MRRLFLLRNIEGATYAGSTAATPWFRTLFQTGNTQLRKECAGPPACCVLRATRD
jgi:hypothetical protein